MKPPRTQEMADVLSKSTNDPILPLDVLYIFLWSFDHVAVYIMTYFEDDFFPRNKWGNNRHPSRLRLRTHRDFCIPRMAPTSLEGKKSSQTTQVESTRCVRNSWICSILKTALKIDLLVASRWAAQAAAQAESEIRSTLLQGTFYNTSEAGVPLASVPFTQKY